MTFTHTGRLEIPSDVRSLFNLSDAGWVTVQFPPPMGNQTFQRDEMCFHDREFELRASPEFAGRWLIKVGADTKTFPCVWFTNVRPCSSLIHPKQIKAGVRVRMKEAKGTKGVIIEVGAGFLWALGGCYGTDFSLWNLGLPGLSTRQFAVNKEFLVNYLNNFGGGWEIYEPSESGAK